MYALSICGPLPPGFPTFATCGPLTDFDVTLHGNPETRRWRRRRGWRSVGHPGSSPGRHELREDLCASPRCARMRLLVLHLPPPIPHTVSRQRWLQRRRGLDLPTI